jgi:hypothetical protein
MAARPSSMLLMVLVLLALTTTEVVQADKFNYDWQW